MKGIDKETGIWSPEFAHRHHSFDLTLAAAICVYYKKFNNYVADLGCGFCDYVKFFKDHFGAVRGYDGTNFYPLPLGIDWRSYVLIDLSQKINPQDIPYYDLVISLEVGEHIPKEKEEIFLDNVANFAKKHLVLSWAVPGQGGKGHVNEKNNDYIIWKMVDRGFKYDIKATYFLRNHSHLPWFHNSLMAFKNQKFVYQAKKIELIKA